MIIIIIAVVVLVMKTKIIADNAAYGYKITVNKQPNCKKCL